MRRLILPIALASGLLPGSGLAQRTAVRQVTLPTVPTGVVVQGAAGAVTVSWTGVPITGATYRVRRAPDPQAAGSDLTPPTANLSVVDGSAAPGATYYYQVVAVLADGTEHPATPVAYAVPIPPNLAVGIGSRVRASVVRVTGITVKGTLATATVSWDPVADAVGYSVRRSLGTSSGCCDVITPAGFTATVWRDSGPRGIGFVSPGIYVYDVTATMKDGTTAVGRASWKRPDPTCDPPPAGQAPLAVLDPTTPAPGVSEPFTVRGPYPDGAVFTWVAPTKSLGVVAYRVERSAQGSNGWIVVGTTCGTPAIQVDPVHHGHRFIDAVPGIMANTTYEYRVTAFAASGDFGTHLVTWTAPSPGVINVLSATASGSSVTFKWRFEPPTSNPPLLPSGFKLEGPQGTKVQVVGPCNGVAGCSATVTGVPSGQQPFVLTAIWTSGTLSGTSGWGNGVVATRYTKRSVAVP